jgi:TolB-like protein/Tfp pilus assembly protein PilF
VPIHIEQVIERALVKKASERYQNIQELIQDLKFSMALPKTEQSIAVLSFSDMSPKKDQEYFCEGIAEELINALTHIKDLHVAARTSAFSFKDKDVDIGEIGRKLKVDKVLEGSVRTAGNKLRVTAQLINVKDGYHLWSEKYDRELEDVFDIQDEITQSIVNALKLKLEIEKETIQEKRHTKNLKAYHLYLKGRYFLYSRYERDLEKAIRHFEQAIDEDPSYTLPYAGLAQCYCFIGAYGYLPPKVAFSKAKTAVEHALDIDESLAEVHTAMGLVRFWGQWDWHGAELEFKRAIDIEPTYVDVYCWYAILLFVLERQEEGIAMTKRALELDPLSHFAYAVSGSLLIATHGQYEEGIEDLKKALQYYPDYIYALWLLGHIYSLCAMHKEAIAAHQKVLALTDRASFYLGSLGMTYGLSGDLDKAEAILHELEERSQRDYVPAFAIAHVWAGMKQPDQTFEWLEKAYNEQTGMIWMVRMPLWDPFRSDPRFEDLLRRLNLSRKS